MPNVLISGGTGLIGSRLTELLLQKSYTVTILSREAQPSSNTALDYVKWDPAKNELPESAILRADYVVNLAGANIAGKRWTEKYKKLLIDSRLQSTSLLVSHLNSLPHKVKKFISASGISYYEGGGEIRHEDDPPADTFLAELCVNWENAARQVWNVPLFIPRIGVVLSPDGGALEPIEQTVKFMLGAPLGSGKQFFPWIHIDDLCNFLIWSMETENTGIYNATSPGYITYNTLVNYVGKLLHRPIWPIGVPKFMVHIVMGEAAQSVLESYRISPDKALRAGYLFQYPELGQALRAIYGK